MPQPASFINKPARGWLHPDHLFAKDGINYAVRYIGNIEVTTSMKVLDFDTRSRIAKESIARVCEESRGVSRAQVEDRRRRVDRKIQEMLGKRVTLSHWGSNVQLTITSLCLKLSDLDSGSVIQQHEMPMISFASGGDSEILDYIAYVAKDNSGGRACYVLECGGGLAQDVITTIGQAFELRFKEFLKKSPRPPPLTSLQSSGPTHFNHPHLPIDDPEYYNDLPGKAPPPTVGQMSSNNNNNLIDLSTELPQQHHHSTASAHHQHHSHLPHQQHGLHHANQAEAEDNRQSSGTRHRDPFDMSPFSVSPPGGGIPSPLSSVPPAPGIPSPLSPAPPSTAGIGHDMRSQLAQEEWFHGPIPRKDAENLLKYDGDFLVRESQGTVGQYVLTGMQGNIRKHLLLVDPAGVVRTRDQSFHSVSHLINYHRNNKLPIISAESALRLTRPVPANRQ